MMPTLSLVPLALSLAAATAEPVSGDSYRLRDAGHDLDAPIALVVITPGLDPTAFLSMVQALEERGLDAWAVRVNLSAPLPPDDADLWIAASLLPAAVAELRAQEPGAERLALVGHGPGGTLALMAAQHLAPTAVAVLGAPIGPVNTEVLAWLAERELPRTGNVDLSRPLAWRGHDLATLLLGDDPPPLGPLPVELAQAGLRWATRGPPLELESIPCPVWIGAAALDRLVPIESLRVPSQRIPDRSFTRFGLLRLDPADPGHADLLMDRRHLDPMANWVYEQLD
jgi:hypothetical protein